MLEAGMSGSTDTSTVSGPSPSELIAVSLTRQQYNANSVNDGADNLAHWQSLDGHAWDPSWQIFTPYAGQQPHDSVEAPVQSNPWQMAADARNPIDAISGGVWRHCAIPVAGSVWISTWIRRLVSGYCRPGRVPDPEVAGSAAARLDTTQFGLDDYGEANAAARYV